MAWKLIEVGDYDEEALTDEELVCVAYIVETTLKHNRKIDSMSLVDMMQSILTKVDDIVKEAARNLKDTT